MPANTSGWSKNQPSGSSSIRLGDDLLRSDKSILEAAFNDEHYFAPQDSASSASGGLHRQGSARVWSMARASVVTPSSADSIGKLVWDTTHGALLGLDATSITTLVGGIQPHGASAELNNNPWVDLTAGSYSTLSWTAGDFNTSAAISNGSTRINAKDAGQYVISAQLEFYHQAGVTGTGAVIIRRNASLGTEVIAGLSTGTIPSVTSGYLNLSSVISAAANDWFEVAAICYGSNTSVIRGVGTRFSARRLS